MIPIGKDELVLLKERVDLVELVRSHGTELKRVGKSFVGLCPFHTETTPSFHVDPLKKTFRCFGCGKTGDAIAFLRETKGLTFRAALEEIQLQYGNGASTSSKTSKEKESVSEASAVVTPSDAERAHLLDLVVTHYEKTLAHNRRAQAYLGKRKLLVPEVLKALRVGYADGSIRQAIAPNGERREELTALGVLTPHGNEALSGCIVVPLLEPGSDAVLQLYGRSVSGRIHRYLAGDLRGLVNAAAAASSEHLVLVESVLDAMSLLVLGIPNVLALYGVNGFKKEHDQVLAAGGTVKTVTLLLDGDAAGKKAAEALGAKLASRGLGVRIATLPSHKDPNEALVAGMTREQLLEVLAQARIVSEPKAAITEAPVMREPAPPARYDVAAIAGGFSLTVGPRRYLARGIRGGGYERLHLNLVLEDGYGGYGDVLDLYVARARTGFARRVARRCGYDEETIERELGYLQEEAERWIAESAKEDAGERLAPPELSADEKEEALAFLKDPQLLDRTVEHLGRLGYVGEETNKALGYLIIVSRKLEDPLSALVLSQSAAGKSGLTEVLERITPPEDVFLFSRLTPAALYYMPKDQLVRKVVIIEEASGSEEAEYSLRTLQSRKRLTLAVPVKDPRTGRIETKVREVLGPAVFLQTSTALAINHENATRCFELYLDETAEQTRKIHTHQRWLKTAAGRDQVVATERLTELHWNAQRLLRPGRVVIPWASLLTFPESWLRTRRDHLRFLNLIEASAFLHQYQRRWHGDAIEATEDDYTVAYNLAAEVLGSTLAELKKPARELLAAMKEMAAELGLARQQAAERVTLTRREVRERTGLPDHQVRRLLADLVDLEHVEVARGGQGRLALYRVPKDAGEPERVRAGLVTPADLTVRLQKANERRTTSTTSQTAVEAASQAASIN